MNNLCKKKKILNLMYIATTQIEYRQIEWIETFDVWRKQKYIYIFYYIKSL